MLFFKDFVLSSLIASPLIILFLKHVLEFSKLTFYERFNNVKSNKNALAGLYVNIM